MRRLALLVMALLLTAVATSGQAVPSETKCPPINLIGPPGIPDEIVFYTAKVGEGGENYQLQFVWSLSTGEIRDGQGTRSISFIRPERSVTITVEIRGLPAGCPSAASEHMPSGHPPPMARKIDVLKPNHPINAFNADLIATPLADQPDASLYILTADVSQNVRRLARKEKDILKALHRVGIRPDRITIARVCTRCGITQFWLVPPGATNPRCDECEELDLAAGQCPTLSVDGPKTVPVPGELLVFTARVSEDAPKKVKYFWRVSSGKILGGQRSSRLLVRAPSDVDGDVTATVEVIGLDRTCPSTASETTPICACVEPILVDEYSARPGQIDTVRLSSFARQLRENPTYKGHIVEYFESGARRAITRKISQTIAFLTKNQGLSRSSIQVISSPSSETRTRLWLLRPGAATPTP